MSSVIIMDSSASGSAVVDNDTTTTTTTFVVPGLPKGSSFVPDIPKYRLDKDRHKKLIEAAQKRKQALFEAAATGNMLMLKEELVQISAKTAAAPSNMTDNSSFSGGVVATASGEVNELRDSSGHTLLFTAAVHGQLETVSYLNLALGAAVNVKRNDGWTAIGSSSRYGEAEMVKMLHSLGADINAADGNGWSPLHSASSLGLVERVRFLLSLGANVNLGSTRDGTTPAGLAAAAGHLPALKALHELGADLSIANTDGWTPLHAAVEIGAVSVLAFLIDSEHCKINAEDRRGWTPLYVATLNEEKKCVEILEGLGAKRGEAKFVF